MVPMSRACWREGRQEGRESGGCKGARSSGVSPIRTCTDEAPPPAPPPTHTHTHTHMYMTGEFFDVPFPFTETLGDTRNLLFFF